MGSFRLWFGDATTARVAPGGMVFHVLNRGVARMQLFEKAADYQAFEQVLRETLDQSPMRICAYAVMPNHWHLLLWPECDGELAAFMQRLTITDVRRWQERSEAYRPQPNWKTGSITQHEAISSSVLPSLTILLKKQDFRG